MSLTILKNVSCFNIFSSFICHHSEGSLHYRLCNILCLCSSHFHAIHCKSIWLWLAAWVGFNSCVASDCRENWNKEVAHLRNKNRHIYRWFDVLVGGEPTMEGFGWLSLSITFRGVITHSWDRLCGDGSFICCHKTGEMVISFLDSPLTRKMGRPLRFQKVSTLRWNDGEKPFCLLCNKQGAQHPVKHNIKPSGTIWKLPLANLSTLHSRGPTHLAILSPVLVNGIFVENFLRLNVNKQEGKQPNPKTPNKITKMSFSLKCGGRWQKEFRENKIFVNLLGFFSNNSGKFSINNWKGENM